MTPEEFDAFFGAKPMSEADRKRYERIMHMARTDLPSEDGTLV